MRDRFQCFVHDPNATDQDDYDQDLYFQTDLVKGDLLDACCHFLEHNKLPRIYQVRANVMMVWLIETETESARYADTAEALVEDLESEILSMFGDSDERVEELKMDVYHAQEEVERRKAEAKSEMDEDEYDDEHEYEHAHGD